MRKSQSVFEQIGFSPEEARALEMKTELMSEIVRHAKQYSQKELKAILREPQPRISNLLRGKISLFSIETLLRYAEALHMRPEIKTHQPKVSVIRRNSAPAELVATL